MEYHCIYNKYTTDKSEINVDDLDFTNQDKFEQINKYDILQEGNYYFVNVESNLIINEKKLSPLDHNISSLDRKQIIAEHKKKQKIEEILKNKKYIGECKWEIFQDTREIKYSFNNAIIIYSKKGNFKTHKILKFINVIQYVFDPKKNKYICTQIGDDKNIIHNINNNTFTFFIDPGFTRESCDYQKDVTPYILENQKELIPLDLITVFMRLGDHVSNLKYPIKFKSQPKSKSKSQSKSQSKSELPPLKHILKHPSSKRISNIGTSTGGKRKRKTRKINRKLKRIYI